MTPTHGLPAEMRERIVALRREGHGFNKIGAMVGCSPATVAKISAEAGIPGRPASRRIDWTAAKDELLTRLVAAGASGIEQARAVGCSPIAVRDRVTKLGLKAPRPEPVSVVVETDWERSMLLRGISRQRVEYGPQILPRGHALSWPFGGSPAVGAP